MIKKDSDIPKEINHCAPENHSFNSGKIETFYISQASGFPCLKDISWTEALVYHQNEQRVQKIGEIVSYAGKGQILSQVSVLFLGKETNRPFIGSLAKLIVLV